MEITSWIALWKIVLILGIGGFSVMAVWVTIGGALDVRKLLRSLREEPAEDAEGKPR